MSSVLPNFSGESWMHLKINFCIFIINICYVHGITWIDNETNTLSAVKILHWKFPLNKSLWNFLALSAENWMLTSMTAMVKMEPEAWKCLLFPKSFKIIRRAAEVFCHPIQTNWVLLCWAGPGLGAEIHWDESWWRIPNLEDTEPPQQPGSTLKWADMKSKFNHFQWEASSGC